jgi:methionine-rich copper-binding protein CopC
MAARTTARRVIVSTLLAVLFGLLFASSAAAHAELTNITPASGAQLTRPPAEVRMTFTESVNLVAGGSLVPSKALDRRPWRHGAYSKPHHRRAHVNVPMPVELPDGSYLITWRSCRPMGIRSVDHCPSSSARQPPPPRQPLAPQLAPSQLSPPRRGP